MTETPAATALHIDLLPRSALASQSTHGWQHVLGVVGFEAPPACVVPSAASYTPPLGSGEPRIEVFRATGAPLSAASRQGPIAYRGNTDVVFGALQIGPVDTPETLMAATESAYRQIFELLGRLPQKHLIRVWHYLPDINARQNGEERYRFFNSARQAAFRRSGHAEVTTAPAACALGSPAGSPLSIYFLAGRWAARMIENPRQTSAYHYPPQFGRHSPLFSRACVWGDGGARFFISGTASIVGHETLHTGDVIAQTRETLTNIEALIGEANRSGGAARHSLEQLALKVYVRRPADLAGIRAVLGERLDPDRAVYLKADICRDDLLIEIEATG